MTEICHLEPKHLAGKDGIGKGSLRRRGEDVEAFRAGWDRIFGQRQEADGAASSATPR
jgi:hypothetical protein